MAVPLDRRTVLRFGAAIPFGLSAFGMASASSAAAAVTTTLSFVAHQDDDLLFMNPDIASDVQAGYSVWVVYLTAGEVPYRDGKTYGGMEYANMRIEGARAAYALAANVPNQWTYEAMYLNGHEVATNQLDGTDVHLVFTFIHAAAAPEDPYGDLYRMLADSTYVATPIDGRAPYTQDSFVGMLSSIIQTVNPDYIRTQSSIGHRDVPNVDHIDHTAGAILAADANVDAQGATVITRYEYQDYIIKAYSDNIFGYWQTQKTAIWDQYWPHDPEVDPGYWADVMARQYMPSDRIFWPGTLWVPPGDFISFWAARCAASPTC
jgi:LmbE family N-acetylglucosaminyl deacetylase